MDAIDDGTKYKYKSRRYVSRIWNLGNSWIYSSFFFSNNGRWKKCEYHFIIVTLTDSIRLQVKTSQFSILKNVKLEKIVFE